MPGHDLPVDGDRYALLPRIDAQVGQEVGNRAAAGRLPLFAVYQDRTQGSRSSPHCFGQQATRLERGQQR